ncbi:MAG: hypothetical protein ISS55_06620 [Dehalococcoidales bacterium]|nr:hypothetical protein [Dehalococcoidales bacterium]
MIDEVTLVDDESQEGNPAEQGTEDHDPGEIDTVIADEKSRDEVGEQVFPPAERGEELVLANARIVELEETVSDRDSEVASLKKYATELEGMLSASRDSLVEAVSRYRDVVIQASPGVLEELVSGDSIASIDESLRNAKSLIGKVREGLEAEVSLARVPAGAPERRLPDLSALSPREKIQYGIGGNK